MEVGEAKYATFVAPFDVDFTDSEVSAYAAKVSGEYVRLTPVTTVPAGTAVVVKAEEGTYTMPKTTDAELGEENELIAATADIAADGTQYILAQVDGEVGFYKASGTIAAGKGYLQLDAAVKAFYPLADDATGVEMVDAQSSMSNGEPVYNLAGQRLGKVQNRRSTYVKGIYIIGKKKIAVN